MTKYRLSITFEKNGWGNGFDCDYVTDENRIVWQRFLIRKVREYLKPETMESDDFKAVEQEIAIEQQRLRKYEEQVERMREADRYRRSAMDRPKIDFIPRGLTVDYEEEYGKFFMQEVTFVPRDKEDFLHLLRFLERWHKKSIPQILAKGRPDAAYAIAMGLCKHLPMLINRDDIADYVKEYKARIGKLVLASYTALVETAKAWCYEEKRLEVCGFIEEHAKEYSEFRGMEKKLLALIPTQPFCGERVEVTREMNEEEEYRVRQIARLKEEEEKARIEAEKEARSVIPLNDDYERRIFNKRNVGWDCDHIWHLMLEENRNIERLVKGGHYMEAALSFMQLTKSMCRHFIIDEHYRYFDDMYSPEYAINDLMELFERLAKEGKLPDNVREYLLEAWKEIEDTECCKDHGLPRQRLDV